MSGRDAIFSKIRRSLGVTGDEATRREEVSERLGAAPRGIIPKRTELSHEDQVALFCDKVKAALATVERVGAPDDVPEAVAAYLRAKNLPATIKRGDDLRLANLPWQKVPNVAVVTGRSDGHDPVGLSHATAGVAETGTLMLVSGNDNPTTLNFLPDDHIVVVDAADVTGSFENVWDRIRERYGKSVMPRTVNMVTGPSRSGDIEQKLLLGAHGPRSLHVIVVG